MRLQNRVNLATRVSTLLPVAPVLKTLRDVCRIAAVCDVLAKLNRRQRASPSAQHPQDTANAHLLPLPEKKWSEMLSMQASPLLKPFGTRLAAGHRLSFLARPAVRHGACKPTVCQAGHKKSQHRDLVKAPQLLGAAGLLTPLLLDVQSALAQKGELGIIEGRTASLIHPAIMLFLFGSTFYTGYLGLQWR